MSKHQNPEQRALLSFLLPHFRQGQAFPRSSPPAPLSRSLSERSFFFSLQVQPVNHLRFCAALWDSQNIWIFQSSFWLLPSGTSKASQPRPSPGLTCYCYLIYTAVWNTTQTAFILQRVCIFWENYSAFKCQDNWAHNPTDNYIKDRNEASPLPVLQGTFGASPHLSQVERGEEALLGHMTAHGSSHWPLLKSYLRPVSTYTSHPLKTLHFYLFCFQNYLTSPLC